jgi:N-carbamoylputrescine amidase
MPRVAFVEWPDGLEPASGEWRSIEALVRSESPDILVTNEMPFGAWCPITAKYDAAAASTWVDLHERGLDALKLLGVPAVISSRPVFAGKRLANEAFVLEGGEYRRLHHKQFFPAEQGWQEAAWFQPSRAGFDVHCVGGLAIGVLLCTELMFNEKARDLGRAGAELIAVPRATGSTRIEMWRVAGAMAAIVSGAFVVSSNRSGQANGNRACFGGHGFAFGPGGLDLGSTSKRTPISVVNIDTATAAKAKAEYPCYVQQRLGTKRSR